MDERYIKKDSNFLQNITHKKEIIKRIQEINGDFKKIEQAKNLHQLLDIVSEDIYSDANRFVIEFIQNCDDSAQKNECLRLEILINEEKKQIIFCYNGKPFSDEDTQSICAAGNSTKKKDENQTGYKGIGFKSVFSNSNKVTIISQGFQFRFDKQACLSEMAVRYNQRKEDLKFPWQFYPIWTELSEIDKEILQHINDFSVNIIIDICDEKHFNECKETILELQNNQAYLLFLKSKNIEISAYDLTNRNYFYTIQKTSDKDHENMFYFTQRDDPSEEKFYIKKFSVDLAKENIDINTLKADTKLPKKLKDMTRVDISFAAKLETNDYIDDQHENINNFERLKEEVIAIEPHKRFIYSYLPTKVNFNLPFLVNSNFILDAGRSQLKDHDFNKVLISLLPSYITKFYNDIKETFKNSYANILFKDFKIDSKKFYDLFHENMQKEYNAEKVNGITVFSNGNTQRNKINKIYFDNFCSSLSLDDHDYKSIQDFFIEIYFSHFNSNYELNKIKSENEDSTNPLVEIKLEVYEENNNADNINYNKIHKKNKRLNGNFGEELIKSFVKDKYNIDLIHQNRIDERDKAYIDKIIKHYDSKYIILNDKALYEFINSEYYSKNYYNQVAYKLVKLLKDNEVILKRIKTENAKVFKDRNGILSTIDKLFFYNLKNQEDYAVDIEEEEVNIEKESKNKIKNNLTNISLSDQKRINQEKKNEKKGNFGDRNLINDELLELFLNNNNIFILQKLCLKEFSDTCELDEILKQIESDYDKKNSYFFIKILFKKWFDLCYKAEYNIDKGDKKHMKEKIINKVKNLKLLTKSNKFLHPHCVILGKEFTGLNDFNDYEDYHLNSRYLNPSIDIKYHLDFFKEAELWHQKKSYFFAISKDNFSDFPFLDKEFIKIFKDEKKVFNKNNQNSIKIFISPDLNFNFYKKKFPEICEFFKAYSHYLHEVKPIIVNKTQFNYFKWFFDTNGKIIPTNKHTLKSVESVYSNEIFDKMPYDIKYMMKELFTFSYEENLFDNLKKAGYKLKTELTPSDIKLLLLRIKENFTKNISSEEKLKIKRIYKDYLFKFSKELTEFDGPFLDTEEEFVKADESYYFFTEQKNEAVVKIISKNYKKLLIPEVHNDAEIFLKFAKMNKCRIYFDKDMKYSSINSIKDKEFEIFTPKLYEYFEKLNDSLRLNQKKNLEKIKDKLNNNIDVYGCSEIRLECKKQIIPHGISFWRFEKERLKIYYLKNDVYTSFKHPTIAYFIGYYICDHFKLDKFRNALLPIIQSLGNEEVIEDFINNAI